MLARLLFAIAVPLLTACGGGLDLTPEPFTRERADGKIPVKTALIREQVLAQLAGMPEGEAKVTRWQHIETDYHACRLLSGKAETASEQVFADCMANRGYVYMYRIDAEHLHNDIEFEVEKEYDKYPDTAQKAAEALLAAQKKREEEQQEFARRDEPPNDWLNSTLLYGLVGIGGVAALAGGGGGGGDNNSSSSPPRITTPTMTMTMPTITTPTLSLSPYRLCFLFSGNPGCSLYNRDDADSAPDSIRRIGLNPRPTVARSLNAPELSALWQNGNSGSWHFHVFFTPSEGVVGVVSGVTITIRRQIVTDVCLIVFPSCPYAAMPSVNLSIWHSESRQRYRVFSSARQVFVEGRPDITRLEQLCAAPWLRDYINQNFRNIHRDMFCDDQSGTSYSPDMRRVVYAAMAEGFNQGVAIGESPFAFSGRYDGDNRAAGFTYHLGDYSLRTDYIRLPSRQDGAVWLDTFRFGALSRVNDEVRLFAGMDNYRNAIFAIDTNGDSRHRFGVAIGEGYAARYEYRIRL